MKDYYKYLSSYSQNLHMFDSGKESETYSQRKVYRENLEREDYYNKQSAIRQSILYLNNDINYIKSDIGDYIQALHSTMQDLIDIKINKDYEILIVGMGNQFMVADSLGIEVAKRLIPTRHIKQSKQISVPSLSVFIPNVLGVTGIETADAVNAMCNLIKPDLVIALDSLCAKSLDRFASTIQLTNKGITPGAGVDNARKKLNKESLGCKVVAVGVPLLIQNINVDNVQSKDGMYFTVADINEKVQIFARIIAGAINKFVNDK